MEEKGKKGFLNKTWRKIVDNASIFLCIISILLFVATGITCYQKFYLDHFWVNGQSMYPTLNGKAVNADGQAYGLRASDADYIGGKNIDFGTYNSHKSALKRLKRFDIVVTRYVTNDDSLKIKRIIGLPGETIRFNSTEIGSDHNGDLYINGKYVAQPIPDEMIKAGRYLGKYSVDFTLKSDEYFVCGDNRGNSSDSLTVGPIKKDFIEGKVVALVGTCQVEFKDNEYVPVNIKYHWPKKLK